MSRYAAPAVLSRRAWARRAILCALLALAALAGGPAFAQGGIAFFTVPPCRAVDTRNAAGPFAGPALAAGLTRVFSLAGRCGVSTGATAISANVTVVGASAAGHLTFFPAGATKPLVSTVN